MHQHHLSSRRVVAVAASLFALAQLGCDDSTSLGSTPPVSFSVSTAEQAAGASLMQANSTATVTPSGALRITAGNDTLIIDSVRVVLAQVTLVRTANAACGTAGHDDSNDPLCANLKAGPLIVKLPLSAGAASIFDVAIPQGSYSAISVRVHQANKGETGPNVVQFLADHPDWENKSIKADGTFNGTPFHWSHDPPAQLIHTFNPPLEVGPNGTNFTLRVDVASWFVSNSGPLIDPNAKTNVLYPQVAAHVAASFKVFSDDTRKGHDDGK